MSIFNSNKLKEPIFLKEDSSAEHQLEQLKNLLDKVDVKTEEKIEYDIACLEKGIYGEKALEFELKNSHIPMYVLHDIYLEHNGLSAQIDYIVITKSGVYIIECKNLFGDITVNSDGSFIRTIKQRNKAYKEGIYSPITQNKRHLELIREIRISQQTNLIMKKTVDKYFYEIFHSVVVLANPKTILNDRFAKKEVKQQIYRCDQLIEYISNSNKMVSEACSFDDKIMKDYADMFLRISKQQTTDYTDKYKEFIVKKDDTVVAEEESGTVICPSCGAPMIKRVAKKGANAGKEFYGCSNFPKCRKIIDVE